ncbi:MAG: elongation factor P maturation arginine rhamnosyltransferase EarP [Casimicrobiaceae bacterium]
MRDDLSRAATSRRRWDLFSRVVDNFGDAGIAWRLARQLTVEHKAAVTLWIDAPAVLSPLCGAPPGSLPGCHADICVRPLAEWNSAAPPPDVVVDILGHGLPPAFVGHLAGERPAFRWFVLEYLSAEAWVEATHGLPSPHPVSGLPRHFWFPGFTAGTGGLLREHDLFTRRDAFAADPARCRTLRHRLGVPDDARTVVSLFCYPGAPVAALLDAWDTGDEPIACLVPEGVAVEPLAAWRARRRDRHSPDTLSVHPVPFVAQDRYDEMLWASDFNFVRGEDSFVRAQWAGRPFGWNVYPQADTAHAMKLDAFVGRYVAGLPEALADTYLAFSRAWNGLLPAAALAPAWRALRAARSPLASHARAWSAQLGALPDLAATLAAASRTAV